MQTITVEELKKRIEAGEQLHIIDVREPHEYAEFNISAKLIPLGKIQSMQIEEIEDLKGAELIIHCRSGARSANACLILDQLGFTNTKNLVGGMIAWREKYGG
jgi:rhodanese-related sulfurtransferase